MESIRYVFVIKLYNTILFTIKSKTSINQTYNVTSFVLLENRLSGKVTNLLSFKLLEENQISWLLKENVQSNQTD